MARPSGLPDEPADLPPLPSLAGAPLRRPPTGGARREWQRGTVVQIRRETPRALTFRLALPTWNAHVPGQHYVVRLVAPDGYRAERSYSVASPPDDAGHIELTVERLADGEVSEFLHDAVRVGDEVDLRGPFGGWFVWRGDSPALLVGGGSGVVPLMAMVRHARRRGVGVPLHLVVSARTTDELFYADELGPETTLVLTREPAPSGRPPGRIAVADVAPHLLPSQTVYLCGSTGFAAHVERLLLHAGLSPGALRVERFGPT